jgi:hypothetical protein
MENQHRLIKGYRDLTPEAIALINEIKEHAEKTGKLLDKISEAFVADDKSIADLPHPLDQVGRHLASGEARRWLSIGKTHLQQGYMAVTRSVARPDFF